MLNDKLWFKAKKFGWGWVPSSKEGWLVTISYVILAFVITPLVVISSILYFLVLFLLTVGLIYICYKTGEQPHWSWEMPGFEKKKKQDKTKL
jgi:hypothetical protein